MIKYTKANKTIYENEMKLVSEFLFFGFREKKQTNFFALPLGYADTLERLLGVCFFFYRLLSCTEWHFFVLVLWKKNKLWNFRAWPMKFPGMKAKVVCMKSLLCMNEIKLSIYLISWFLRMWKYSFMDHLF